MGIHNGKREKPITVHINRIPPGKVKEIELVWDRKLMLAISCDDGIHPRKNPNQGTAAIDMGEIHGIADTTRVYAKPSLAMMREAMDSVEAPRTRDEKPLWVGSEEGMAKLCGLR